MQGNSRFNRRAVPVGEAQRRLLEAVRPLPSETVPLWLGSGRYAAELMAATTDWPPFARAGMDGYAVRAADIALATPEQPAALRVVDTVAAGDVSAATVEAGTAARIMTGAAVPAGADAVIQLEMTAHAPAAAGEAAASAAARPAAARAGAAAPQGAATVLVKQPVPAGRNIAPPGEEFRRGDAIAQPGERLRPGHIALLGSCGYAELRVHRRPRVAIFATGTELLPVGAALAPGRIRDSNSAMIAALVAGCGCEPLPMGRLDDEPAVVAAALSAALREADAVVTTGGVSVGDYDVVAALMRRLRDAAPAVTDAPSARTAESAVHDAPGAHAAEPAVPDAPSAHAAAPAADSGAAWPPADMRAEVLFDKVAMRPGSPTSAAMLGGKPLLALSGNPGACYVGFELFVRPMLLRMQGDREPLPAEWMVELASPIDKSSPHERFVQAKLRVEDGRLIGDPYAFAKSSMMASLPTADLLLRVPAGPHGMREGELVAAIPLRHSARL